MKSKAADYEKHLNCGPNSKMKLWIALSIMGLSLSGCLSNSLQKPSGSPSPSPSPSETSAPATFKISNVLIQSTGAGSSQVPSATVFIDKNQTSPSTASINQHCTVANSSGSSTASNTKPCVCKFTWQEVNGTDPLNPVTLSRAVQTTITQIQPNLLICEAPSVYLSEIPEGTPIELQVTGGISNPDRDKFTIPVYSIKKNTSATTGTFQDAAGRSYDNILRYSCYDRHVKGLKLASKTDQSISNDNTGETSNLVLANSFCTGDNNSQGCGGRSQKKESAQSYYYNLFIRNTDRGNINSDNGQMRCPKVQETLDKSIKAGSGSSLENDYWPLDTSFALALNPNPDFPVGVEAFSKLALGSDPTSQNSSCYSGSTGNGSNSGDGNRVKSCLGFAAKPNSNGSCPSFQDSSGTSRQTYRLRRYIALYPPRFKTGGKPEEEAPPIDVIYVIDRPVAADPADPDTQVTMLGPKPCPFAFFDHDAVAGIADGTYPASPGVFRGGVPQYRGTNDSGWNNTNIDGIEFPNIDVTGNSCSAAMPILNADRSVFTIATVHTENPTYKSQWVRPQKPWSPHYLEDTSFEACAPLSAQSDGTPLIIDPPLHFAKNAATNNVAWCAEAYPTQNPYIAALDKRNGYGTTGNFLGKVRPFTSHAAKYSQSDACTRTPTSWLPGAPTYPAAPSATTGACSMPLAASPTGIAHHPNNFSIDSVPNSGGCQNNGTLDGANCVYCTSQACDRTVQDSTSSPAWFPLLAPSADVEKALQESDVYSCLISHDGTGSKNGKASPSGGCCAVGVTMTTGAGGVTAAHLEPSIDPTKTCTPGSSSGPTY